MANRKTAPAPKRQAATTVLAVGEGRADYLFIEHVRALYLPRFCGTSATVKAATGKGAGRVIAYTAALSNRGDFTRVVALVDTDTDWTVKVQTQARQANIIVIPSSPCLEALLLQIAGNAGERTTAQHKREFRAAFGMDAEDSRVLRDVYPRWFDRNTLEGAKGTVRLLSSLLNALVGDESPPQKRATNA